MYNKPIRDMEANTGIYDFVYIEQDHIYSYLSVDFLTDISALLAEHPELQSPDFDFGKFTSFIKLKQDDGIYGVPMEAFIKPYLYALTCSPIRTSRRPSKSSTGMNWRRRPTT